MTARLSYSSILVLPEVASLESLGSSKVTRKFQVTVPRSVREALMLEMGDLVVFVKDRGSIALKRGAVKVEE